MPQKSDKDDKKSSSNRGWYILLGFSTLSALTSSRSGNLLLMVVVVAAVVLAVVYMSRSKRSEYNDAYEVIPGRKPKNSDGNLDPLRLLTPDDREELRQDIKAELRARIVGGSDGELSSLDALLAEQDEPHQTAKK